MSFHATFSVLIAATAMLSHAAPSPATFTLSGSWNVEVQGKGFPSQVVQIKPPRMVEVRSEKYSALPLFQPKASGWMKGAQLKGVKAQETTSPKLLDPQSVVLRSGPQPDSTEYVRSKDYEIDPEWGTFGRLEGGRIRAGQDVFVDYRHAQLRLDAVILTSGKKIIVREGMPRSAAPEVPAIQPGERHLGNIYLSGNIPQLGSDHLFPILEQAYPESLKPKHPVIAKLKKQLSGGQSLRILAWGDSVTDGSYLPNKDTQRWQEQFVARLRKKYPKAKIELITEAWGGRNTGSYLAEPPGSVHNYQEKVLDTKPDLIISEFVNDAGLNPARVEERYTKLLNDFQKIGAEWIILTPHYVRPDWMGLTGEHDIDRDPRPYVEGLRQFTAKHNVPLADASLRYGRLWRQGVPYNTLMLNTINHPNAFGMSLFADALMELFK